MTERITNYGHAKWINDLADQVYLDEYLYRKYVEGSKARAVIKWKEYVDQVSK